MAKHNHSLRERLPYRATTPLYHEVPKGGYIGEIVPVATGTVTVANGTVNGTAVGEEMGAGLFQRFDLDAITNGKYADGKLRSVTPRSIRKRNVFDLGFGVTDLSLGATFDGRAGTFYFNAPYPIRFALPGNAVSAFDTALNAYAYGSLKLTIQTGGRDVQFSGNDRDFDYSGLVLDIYDKREAAGRGDGKVAVIYETDQYIPLPGANPRMPINADQLPQDGKYFDALFIFESGATQALSDAILNKLTVFSGTEQWQELYAARLKNWMVTSGLLRNVSEDLTGCYYVPIAQDGMLGGAVSPVSFLLDVAAPSLPNVDRSILNSRRVVTPGEMGL